MAEEILEQQETQENSNQIYLDAISKLKSETVSVDEYNKLKQDNANLLNAMLEGKSTTVEEPIKKMSAAQCREALFKPEHELNDIEYVSRALQLREAVLAETGEDCFVPKAHNYAPSKEAFESAQRTAEVFQQCIDYAQGDNGLFINELQRRTNDVMIPRKKK
ncbi:MAG: hypothetical protein KBT03_13005 [Bacteroidales bacterium]|nr:hypothetical protein [Candidatus Scybalousia scybalohippi]